MKKMFMLLFVLIFTLSSRATILPVIDGYRFTDFVSSEPIVVNSIDTIGLTTTDIISYYDITFTILNGNRTFNTSNVYYYLNFELESKILYQTETEVRFSGSQLFEGPIGPGNIVNNIQFNGSGPFSIEIANTYDGYIKMAQIDVIPEPSTVALLGFLSLMFKVKKGKK